MPSAKWYPTGSLLVRATRLLTFGSRMLLAGGKASEYTVFVTAGNQTNTSTFDIASYNTLREISNPGGGGILRAAMPTTTTAAVTFNTSEVATSLTESTICNMQFPRAQEPVLGLAALSNSLSTLY